MAKELYTYLHDDDAKTAVHFLALGNLPTAAQDWFSELKTEFPQVDFHGMEWRRLREIFQHSEWEAPQDKRIVADCLKALTLYGIRAPLLPGSDFINIWQKHRCPLNTHFEGTINDSRPICSSPPGPSHLRSVLPTNTADDQ
jgi:hypothetical protein